MTADVASYAARYDRRILATETRGHFGPDGYYNVGLWEDGVADQADACRRLVERLLALLAPHEGRVLDVACGLGASVARLGQLNPSSLVVGLNVSRRQLEDCRRRAPGATWVQADAAYLPFADGSFERLLSVEAAFHFRTRQRFLREAYRVLVPGGRIVLSDLLMRTPDLLGAELMPAVNCSEDLADYLKGWAVAGFTDIHAHDATDLCWRHFCRHMATHDLARCEYFRALADAPDVRYVLVVAARPTSH